MDNIDWKDEAWHLARKMAELNREQVFSPAAIAKMRTICAHSIQVRDGDAKAYLTEYEMRAKAAWALFEEYAQDMPMGVMVLGEVFVRLLSLTAVDPSKLPQKPSTGITGRNN